MSLTNLSTKRQRVAELARMETRAGVLPRLSAPTRHGHATGRGLSPTPSSLRLELLREKRATRTVPDYMVPFAPILEHGEQPFSMFVDLQNKYDWVLQPVIGYPSVDRLIEVLEDKIVRPAEAKFNDSWCAGPTSFASRTSRAAKEDPCHCWCIRILHLEPIRRAASRVTSYPCDGVRSS